MRPPPPGDDAAHMQELDRYLFPHSTSSNPSQNSATSTQISRSIPGFQSTATARTEHYISSQDSIRLIAPPPFRSNAQGSLLGPQPSATIRAEHYVSSQDSIVSMDPPPRLPAPQVPSRPAEVHPGFYVSSQDSVMSIGSPPHVSAAQAPPQVPSTRSVTPASTIDLVSDTTTDVGSVADTVTEVELEAPPAPPKRGRGRPPGVKNKPKDTQVTRAKAKAKGKEKAPDESPPTTKKQRTAAKAEAGAANLSEAQSKEAEFAVSDKNSTSKGNKSQPNAEAKATRPRWDEEMKDKAVRWWYNVDNFKYNDNNQPAALKKVRVVPFMVYECRAYSCSSSRKLCLMVSTTRRSVVTCSVACG